MTEKSKPTLDLKTGLSGRWFITRDERGRTIYQGLVHCIFPSQMGDLVLIQYAEWMMGELNTMAIVTLASMVNDTGENPGYVFFEDNEHLKSYMDNVQRHRDKHIDRAEERERERAKEQERDQ